jgi:hypothetical protein
MISHHQKIEEQQRGGSLYLLDFGISKKYRDLEGKHKPLKLDVPFCGNIVFASKNAFHKFGTYFKLISSEDQF